MNKLQLIEENNKLFKKVEELEKELNKTFEVGENRVLYEMNNLLREQLYFYQELLRNLTCKDIDKERWNNE